MENKYHQDPVVREGTVVRYLSNRLAPNAAEEFENHYLACQDCYEEVRATELLISGLGLTGVERVRSNGVTVIRFNSAAQLTGSSADLDALVETVRVQDETRVLIDLSRVSRIDSTGLGVLMSCYSHAVRNSGMLKLLNPNRQVKQVLSMTHIDSVVHTFEDEDAALASFE